MRFIILDCSAQRHAKENCMHLIQFKIIKPNFVVKSVIEIFKCQAVESQSSVPLTIDQNQGPRSTPRSQKNFLVPTEIKVPHPAEKSTFK